MTNYRKLYNQNILGTSDISILKFYYASYKIQEGKGNVDSIGEFLDLCAKTATDTSKYAKILGFLPFVASDYSAELKRIAKFITLRRSDVEALFQKDDITDKDVECLLYGIDEPENKSIQDIDYYKEKIKDAVLKCYSINGKKQLGDRIFGYFIKSNIIEAYNNQQRLEAWQNLIGDFKPSDIKLVGNPKLNRSNNKDDNLTLIEHLESIQEFYDEIGLPKIVEIIQKDIDKLSSKNQ